MNKKYEHLKYGATGPELYCDQNIEESVAAMDREDLEHEYKGMLSHNKHVLDSSGESLLTITGGGGGVTTKRLMCGGLIVEFSNGVSDETMKLITDAAVSHRKANQPDRKEEPEEKAERVHGLHQPVVKGDGYRTPRPPRSE